MLYTDSTRSHRFSFLVDGCLVDKPARAYPVDKKINSGYARMILSSVAAEWCSARRTIMPFASAEKQHCMSDTSFSGRYSSGLDVLEETLIIIFKT